MTFISDMTEDTTAVAGLDWIETEKAAGDATSSRKVLINNILRPDMVDENVWLGKLAMASVASGGTGNVGIGESSLTALTTGDNNVAVGYKAGAAITTAAGNVAIGKDALLVAVAANDDNCVAIGLEALKAMVGTASGENTAVGAGAGLILTTGVNNTFIGRSAGLVVTTGSSNVMIGVDTACSATSAASQICIGPGATSLGDKDCNIGDGTDTIQVDWDTDATWAKVSDERIKNVQGLSTLGLGFINDLEPIVYTKKPVSEWPKEWDIPKKDVDGNNSFTNTNDRIHGMLAQKVKAALDKAGVDDFAGWKVDPKGRQRLSEAMFVYPLINAVNELTERVAALESEGPPLSLGGIGSL